MEEEEPTISSLLESEKEEIEDSILKKFNREEVVPITLDVNQKKKHEIIEDIHKIQKELNLEITPESKLKRKTKPELIKIMAEIMNKQIEPEPETATEEEKTERTENMLGLITENMFTIHSMLVGFGETASESLKHKTNDVSILKGISERNQKKKPQLLEIFKAMYGKYKSEMDQFLTPLAMYVMAVSTLVVETATDNMIKKKENSSEDS